MTHIHPRRFAMALAAAVALVLSAPFLGQIRSLLQRAYPDHFVPLVGGLIAAAALAALAASLLRVRDRRAARFTTIGAALAIAALYATANASGNRDSDIVELFHFVQYGVVTLLFYRACRGAGDLSMIVLPIIAGAIVGAAEEWFQWFLPARVGEIRDLYLNLAATSCGMLFSLGFDPPERFSSELQPGSATLIGRFTAAAILVLALFIQVLHLGYRIADDEIGLFDSRFSRQRLLALQAEKAEQWRIMPPPAVLQRVSREDQYLTEGIQHAQERNEQWEAGDIFAAWKEHLILEQYYAPVLAVRSYAAPAGVAWPTEQRADAHGRAMAHAAANPARFYVSGAYPYPIFTWPRWLFWTVSAASAALALVLGAGHDRRRQTAAATRNSSLPSATSR